MTFDYHHICANHKCDYQWVATAERDKCPVCGSEQLYVTMRPRPVLFEFSDSNQRREANG